MKIIVSHVKDGDVPIYDKDPGRKAVFLGDEVNDILELTSPSRVLAPVCDITSDRLRAVVKAMECAEKKGCEHGMLVVSDQKIGFVSI